MVDSKQKCLNRIIGTQESGCFDSEKNGRGFTFLHLKSEKSMDFEHKHRDPGNRKTENFGCFMAFSRSPNSPNGELKTKKASRFDWRRFYSIIPLLI